MGPLQDLKFLKSSDVLKNFKQNLLFYENRKI